MLRTRHMLFVTSTKVADGQFLFLKSPLTDCRHVLHWCQVILFLFFLLLLKWSRSARRSLAQPELQRRNPHCGHSRSSLVTIKQGIFRDSAVAHVAQVNMPHFAAWQAPLICRLKQLPKCVFLHLAETRHAPLRSYRLYFFNIFLGAKKAPKMMSTSSTLGRNLCLRLASLNRCIVVIL